MNDEDLKAFEEKVSEIFSSGNPEIKRGILAVLDIYSEHEKTCTLPTCNHCMRKDGKSIFEGLSPFKS